MIQKASELGFLLHLVTQEEKQLWTVSQPPMGEKKHLAKKPSSQVLALKKKKSNNSWYHLENQNVINVLIPDE